ncbi:MAG TPA: carboxypeptidase regulatory-like domain-containing protein [Vicinamibacterales bacterium]|jgi:hypothetical protein|nr:carboxypeptidase regulatory-like domain-containing protein [Vicinamibacterales bacterium]
MDCKIGKLATLLVAVVLTFGFVTTASAQVFTGRIDVTVEDATGGRLPGVNVDLSGPVNQSQITDSQGQAHFLNLTVGTYTVKASLSGFNPYSNASVVVAAGAATPVSVRLAVAGTAETVNVVGATPIIDIKKQTTSTNVTLEELQNIPTARDPWVVMQTVPTIVVDRVNVGGSESGQQSNYFAKGAVGGDNTWNIDGIPITDMAATGSTPTYYDFDMFQEMQITTGGADAQSATPGVQLNFVLKSGTNTPHGSARFFFENEDLQGNNLDSTLAKAIGGSTDACKNSGYTEHCGNRTDTYKDRGFEVGGPIMKDKLWAWGSFGQTNVRNITLNGVKDATQLQDFSIKVTAQPTSAIRPEFTAFRGNKTKQGRSAGPTRPDETTWDQDGPTTIYKGQVNFVIGQNLFVAARGAHMPSGFQLAPRGGLTTQAFRDVSRVWHGSYLDYSSDRPTDTVLADANVFRGRHEVKFGFGWRKAQVLSQTTWPGNNIYTLARSTYPTNGAMLAFVTRPNRSNNQGRYANAYVGDTISMDRLTVNLALRWDRNVSDALVTAQPANGAVPNLVPALTAPAIDDAVKYQLVSPRAGITYKLDSAGKSLLRASYSMFSSQLGSASGGFASAASYAYAVYFATDRNGNNIAEPNEFTSLFFTYGFNPANPSAPISYNKVDPDLKAPKTHEFLAGVDHELMPNFGLSGTFTYRRFNDLIWNPLIGVTRNDYVVDQVLTGNISPVGSFSQNVYALREDKAPVGSGRFRTNRPSYHQRYWGFEASATKRMANRWMGRFGFSTNDHREYFDDPNVAIQDPTPTVSLLACCDPNTLENGGPVMVRSTGSGKSGLYLVNPKYQFIANGLVQGPWGINFGANWLLRQGFAQPFFAGSTETNDPVNGTKDVMVVKSVDTFRLDAVSSLDARVEKAFKFNRTSIMLDLDIFNIGNSATVLGRQYDINAAPGATGPNQILEIMNPRIMRLGVRLTF